MDAIKVKNFIILVLVIVNTVLLAVILTDSARGTELRREAVEGAVQLLSEYGISVSDDAQLGERSLSVYTVTRSEESERATAEALLGEVSMTDRGGGIIYYGGTYGEAIFRGTGGFDIQFSASGAPEAEDMERTALEYAKKLGISLLESSCRTTSSDSSTVLTYTCAADGASIINCTVEFRFMLGRLYSVSGTRPLDYVTSETDTSVIDVPTALMRFLELTREKGHICSELRGLELCYAFSASASGEGSLTPTWLVVTDTGEFYINALTGREEVLA